MAETNLPFEVVTETPGLKVFLSSYGKYYVATYEGFRYSYVKRSGNHHVFRCSPGDKKFNRCPGKLFLDPTYTRVVDGPLDNGVSQTHTHCPNQQKCNDSYEFYKALHKPRVLALKKNCGRFSTSRAHYDRTTATCENDPDNSITMAKDPSCSSIPADDTSADQMVEAFEPATPNPPETLQVNTDAQAPAATNHESGNASTEASQTEARNHSTAPNTTSKSTQTVHTSAFKHISINLNRMQRSSSVTANGSTNNTRALLNERDFKILQGLNASVDRLKDSGMDSAEALQHLVVTDAQKVEKLGVLADHVKLQTEIKKRKLELLEEMVVLKKKKQASLEEIVAIKTLKLKRELAVSAGNKKS